jgi:hypothetical protein
MKYCLLIIALLAGCSQLPVSVPSDADMVMPVASDAPIVIRPPAPAPAMAPPPPPPPPPAMFITGTGMSAPIASMMPPPAAKKRAAKVETKQVAPLANAIKAVDEIASQLTDAALIVDIPASANVADDVRAKVVIDPSKSVGQIAVSTSATAVGSTIKISKIVEAKLIAPDFTIVAFSPDRQAISQSDPTTWEWELSGAKPGKHDVHISISAIVSVDNDRAERLIKTFESTVVVEITTRQWLLGLVKQYWQWVFTALLIPLAKWLWSKWKDGRK